MIVAVTGHRPAKLGGFSPEAKDRLEKFACCCIDPLRLQYPTLSVLTGMALGWDQAIAKACIVLNVPFIAALPCQSQDTPWPPAARAEYRAILARAASVQTISPFYTLGTMQARNRWMVDHADVLVALFDGSPGGTYNCVMYAERKNKPIYQTWEHWRAFTGEKTAQ